MTAALEPRPEISLTTNGIGLARLAGPLAAAGLDRLNVSLDTLSRQTFITESGAVAMDAIFAAGGGTLVTEPQAGSELGAGASARMFSTRLGARVVTACSATWHGDVTSDGW